MITPSVVVATTTCIVVILMFGGVVLPAVWSRRRARRCAAGQVLEAILSTTERLAQTAAHLAVALRGQPGV